MKQKLIVLAGVLVLAVAPLATAQTTTSISSLQNGLSSFVDNTAPYLPFAASAGLDWSNAYIGQLVDTSFPWVHLGVGIAGGVTSLPTSSVNPLLTAMGQSETPAMGIPFTVFNLRLGGLVWPFDVGFKIGFLPSGTSTGSYNFTYSNLGFDVRYSLLKSDPVWPDVSVGGGINYMSASAKGTYGTTVTYTDPTNASNKLTVQAPTMELKMSALEFEAKAQVSKTLLFILTPYLGLTAFYGTGHAEAGATANITSSTGSISDWQKYLPGITTTGFTKSSDQGSFGMKIWGGTSVDILIVKFDFQGMYSLFNGAYGGSAGVRIEI